MRWVRMKPTTAAMPVIEHGVRVDHGRKSEEIARDEAQHSESRQQVEQQRHRARHCRHADCELVGEAHDDADPGQEHVQVAGRDVAKVLD